MKKFLPYIERYVHWVVLGLGAVYVLYMVYAYVITPPVTATVGNKTVDLGNVDRVTAEGPAAQLQQAIQQGATSGEIKVPTPLPIFQKGLSGADLQPVSLATANLNAPTIAPPGALPPTIPGQPNPAPQQPGSSALVNNTTPAPDAVPGEPPKVKDFAPPAPTFVNLVAGRSAVTPPPPSANPQAAVAGQPNPVQPVQPIQPIQNVQPVNGVAAVNPALNVPTIDKNWVSLHYKIPSTALAAAFKNAGVPPVRNVTSFLRVELVRQEQLRDGKWGNETVVGPPQFATLTSPIWPLPPVANPDQQAANVQAYITWAQQQASAQAILQPVFYNVVKGDVPGVPGDPMQHVGLPQLAQKQFDPANPGPPPPGGYTAEQKELIKQYQIQKAAQQRQNRPAPRAPRGPGGRPGGPGGPGGEPAFAPRDTDRPATLSFQARPPYRGPVYNGGDLPEDMGDGMGGIGGMGVMQQPNNAALLALAQTIPNQSPFDPSQLSVDIDVLAYDETAEPGKTFRYQMRYYILNPVAGIDSLVANPAFAQKWAIPSENSVWSPPVFIEPTVSFFLAGGAAAGETARIDLYRWQNGDVNKVTQNVVPGDRISVTKDGVDYSTPWTVVDVRNGNNDKYVLLQTDDGMTERREMKTDANKQVKRDLDAQVEAVRQAAEAARAATRPAIPGAQPPQPRPLGGVLGGGRAG